MKNFVCVCWGDKYPFEYVQKLYNMVQRNTTVEHKFIVFTDSVSMHNKLSPEIEIRKLRLVIRYKVSMYIIRN